MADKKTYKQLKSQLDELLAWFDQEDIDIDEALEKYKAAGKVVKELEELLESYSLRVKQL